MRTMHNDFIHELLNWISVYDLYDIVFYVATFFYIILQNVNENFIFSRVHDRHSIIILI